MAFEGYRARSHAHSRRHGRFTVHGLVVALAVGAVVFASQFPNASDARTLDLVPSFTLSGMGGTSQARALAAFRPSGSIQTLESVATTGLRNEALSVRAVGAVSPTTSLSSGVSAA